MTFNPNDPKWTAYVLNELDARARAEIEQEIAANPQAKQLVEELRETTQFLSGAFAQEPEIALDDQRRETILNQAARPPAGRSIAFPWWRFATIGAAAAALVIAVIGVQQHQREARQGVTEGDLGYQAAIAPLNDADTPAEESGAKFKGQTAESPARSVSREEKPTDELRLDQELVEPLNEDKKEAEASDLVARSGAAPAAAPAVHYPEKSLQVRSRNAVGYVRQNMAIAPAQWAEAPPPASWGPSLDDYTEIRENAFQRVIDHPLSTFSIDVDTASYSQVRKMLLDGRLPPKDAVRIEELINYFPYAYAPPVDAQPFASHLELMPCPWNPAHQLARIALKGKELDAGSRPPLNLVFLLDVSGSMNEPNKLPLVKRAMQALVNQLGPRDRVAITVYAGAAGLVLEPTSGENRQAILDAIERLQAGGSTAGGAGIELAYKTAQEHFDAESVNRVILCTDGDFNVGMTQSGDLVRLIEAKAKSGVFLNVLGFGMGNYKDGMLEELSNKGNGTYAYIDNFSEARKVLVDQMTGTLVTIAKDVKIQVEFNPARVAGYRLIGYENRMLKKEDFNNDKVDAGEIGAGHTVTAIYELVPAGLEVEGPGSVDPLKYQSAGRTDVAGDAAEILTLKLRYKQPEGDTSVKVEVPLAGAWAAEGEGSADLRFAVAVAAFGQVLRESPHTVGFTYESIVALAQGALGADPNGYRAEFIKLVRNAQALTGNRAEGAGASVISR